MLTYIRAIRLNRLFMRTHFDRQLCKPYLGLRDGIQLLLWRMLRLSLGKKSESVKTKKKIFTNQRLNYLYYLFHEDFLEAFELLVLNKVLKRVFDLKMS